MGRIPAVPRITAYVVGAALSDLKHFLIQLSDPPDRLPPTHVIFSDSAWTKCPGRGASSDADLAGWEREGELH